MMRNKGTYKPVDNNTNKLINNAIDSTRNKHYKINSSKKNRQTYKRNFLQMKEASGTNNTGLFVL